MAQRQQRPAPEPPIPLRDDEDPGLPEGTQTGGSRIDEKDERPDLDAAGEVATQADSVPGPKDQDQKAQGGSPRNPTRHPRRGEA